MRSVSSRYTAKVRELSVSGRVKVTTPTWSFTSKRNDVGFCISGFLARVAELVTASASTGMKQLRPWRRCGTSSSALG